jgi:hypothetical protein
MDLLSKYTIEYTGLLTDGSSQEGYLKCKEAIKAIQLEIEARENRETVSTKVSSNITRSERFDMMMAWSADNAEG